MIVYRVQNEHDMGPFSGHSRVDFNLVGHDKGDACWFDGPNPQAEALDHGLRAWFMEGDWVCGVDSPRDLERWFPAPDALALLGYALTVWDVDTSRHDVWAFRWQVVFDPGSAQLVGTHPISDTWVDTLRNV